MREAAQPVGADAISAELRPCIFLVILRNVFVTKDLPVPGRPSTNTKALGGRF